MPDLTPNIGLKKPLDTETADISVVNGNMDIIDTKLHDAQQQAAGAIPATGGAMTGPLTLSADPTEAMHAVTKQYADQKLSNAAGAVGDTNIGERTADPAQAPSGLTGTLTNWLSWFTNRIKAILGTTNWYDAPPTTLTAANNHINNTSNPHNVTPAQIGAATAAQGTKADNALPASSYTASDVLAKIKTVDGSGSGLDADLVHGLNLSITNTPSTIPVRDSNGNIAGEEVFSKFADIWNDLVVSGLLPTTSSNLTTTTPAGLAYVLGKRVTTGNDSHTYAASSDTYIDLSNAGGLNYIGVANGATTPAVTANSMRIAKVVTSATAVTGVTDLSNRFMKVNGKLSTPYNVLDDGTGNMGLGITPTYGLHQLGGGARVQALVDPAAPTVTASGTTGTTSYTYYIVAKDRNGRTTNVSPATTIANGNATLGGSNYNHITWTAVPGAVSYDVLKGSTSTALTTGYSGVTAFNDIGQATSAYTAPTRNTTGDAAIDGSLFTQNNHLDDGTVNGNAFFKGGIAWNNGNLGAINAPALTTDQGGSIEIGSIGTTAVTPYIDFHTGVGQNDYDARIQATGGTSGSNGAGNITIVAKVLQQTLFASGTADGFKTVAPDNRQVLLVPSAAVGNYNPITLAGDSLITGGQGAAGGGPNGTSSILTIAPWSTAKSGIRLGGGGTVYTANNTLDDGTGNGVDLGWVHIVPKGVAGAPVSPSLGQGAYLSWNHSAGTGETNFLNHPGTGGGGWYFKQSANSTTSSFTTEAYITGTGQGYFNGTYSISDERLKKDIVLIDNALEKVKQIQGVHYRWNEKYLEAYPSRENALQVGVLAQEVEKVLPEAITVMEGIEIDDGEEYKTVDYARLVPLLIQAVKELNDKVDKLTKEGGS
ncbi:tail fiber domain-containing protein [Aneurinibacillus sp. Ricciae_BoGa-3]|uniref:tail fiber domain-containing protein n=1 Tax=Aneurinibacillus sp. Ricciae_BoGa-3 TaxID=3022697 RepID=UPI00233FF202|nr:tail fiber domain-containing protein [Aneurinibacillus sp. Ricciae_BoGa-3]WCK53828.1 tail fiber domain-containing protein [Aneurinibacillus sp. Ricciae_BoGa-3]